MAKKKAGNQIFIFGQNHSVSVYAGMAVACGRGRMGLRRSADGRAGGRARADGVVA